MNPFVELLFSDGKSGTKLFHCIKMQKIFTEDTENKKQAVAGIRNDKIRQDSMGMVTAAAVAAYPENGDLMHGRSSANKVDQFSGVIAVNRKRALCITYRTGFQFRPDKFHKTVKQRF